MRKTLLGLLLGGLCWTVASAQTITLQSHAADTSLPALVIKEILRREGLNFSHPYQSEGSAGVSDARKFSDLEGGELDIMWSMTSKDLEQRFRPLYYPLYRGILGMRVGLVRADRAQLFAGVRNLADLQRFTAGQGKTWSDTFILEANGLKVAKTLKYPNLFPMLEGGRFDYFPRGLYEPWAEIDSHRELNLVVEPHLLIKYTAPLYFFTRKDNAALAERIAKGLEAMIADGSYDQLFFADAQVREGLAKANLPARTVIELDNPYLTPETPLERAELWFNPMQAQ